MTVDDLGGTVREDLAEDHSHLSAGEECDICGKDLTGCENYRDCFLDIILPGYEELGRLSWCNKCYYGVNIHEHYGDPHVYSKLMRRILRGSTAFEQAFALLKMPIDWDSIEQVKPKSGSTVTTADFIHPDPDIDEKLKLILYGGSQVRAYEPEDVGDDPYDAHGHVAQAEYHQPVDSHGKGHPLQTDFINVDEEHRRKGLATAMHDLMAHAAAKHGNKLHPSFIQSEAARQMWAKQLGTERPFRRRIGSHPDDEQWVVHYERGEDADTWPVRDDL